ncbi:MAG: amino acid permease, partial [Thermoleophilia bacterium]|nr:amino acid permease [Thermoleophilia bacterium]
MATEVRALGVVELTAISLGGMIGGGIFSILGLAAQEAGNAAPVGIAIGAVLAFFAAYPYVQLARCFQEEGATYSFFKRAFPTARRLAAAIGWLVVFGYICTLALYAFTFGAYVGDLIGQPGST